MSYLHRNITFKRNDNSFFNSAIPTFENLLPYIHNERLLWTDLFRSKSWYTIFSTIEIIFSVNETHFKGIKSGNFMEFRNKASNKHRLFLSDVIISGTIAESVFQFISRCFKQLACWVNQIMPLNFNCFQRIIAWECASRELQGYLCLQGFQLGLQPLMSWSCILESRLMPYDSYGMTLIVLTIFGSTRTNAGIQVSLKMRIMLFLSITIAMLLLILIHITGISGLRCD